MSIYRSIGLSALLAIVALGLAACGGSDGDSVSGASVGASGTSTTQSGGADAFIARVLAVIGTTSETGEPAAVGSETPTTPENSAAVPLG